MKCCWGEECACILKEQIDRLKLDPVKAMYLKKDYTSNEYNSRTGELNFVGENLGVELEFMKVQGKFNNLLAEVTKADIENALRGSKKIKVPEKDAINQLISDNSGERSTFLDLAKYTLTNVKGNTTGLNNLELYWALSKFYNPSVTSTDTYPISKVVEILVKYSGNQTFNRDNKELLILVNSFKEKGAKAITFDTNDTSVKFLIGAGHDKFKSNASSSQGNLIKLLEKVFHDLGTKYEPVTITSGRRSKDEQAKIMYDLMYSGKNLHDYYSGASKSAPYLEVIQNRYEGKHTTMPTNLGRYSEFLQIEKDIILKSKDKILDVLEEQSKKSMENLAKPFQGVLFHRNSVSDNEIKAYLDVIYILPDKIVLFKIYDKVFKGSKSAYKIFLDDTIWHKGLIVPSFHQIGQAYDLSITTTSQKALSLHTGGGRETTEGNKHIHLTI